MEKNIIAYGGTFDPPTDGHGRVVSWVIETLEDVDRVILLPSWARVDKDFWTNNEQRGLLIQKFHEDLLEQNIPVEVDNYFFDWKNGAMTTTIQENEYFIQRLWIAPEFVYWSDVIPNMPNWDWNIDKYLEKVLRKIFIARPGYDVNPEEFGIGNYRIAEIKNIPDVSSSMARERIKVGESVEWILNSSIIELIKTHSLYQ